MRQILTILILPLLLAGIRAVPGAAQIPRVDVTADLVVVHKSARTLELMREGRVLRTFTIALGPHPTGPKRKEGDGRTPEGVYTLDWRNSNSQYYRAIHISYPGPHDALRAERWGVPAGGLIMLHGLPNGVPATRLGHPWNNWTNGCIAVTDAEIDEIWSLVEDGTTIIIYP